MAVSLKQAWAFIGGVSEVNVQTSNENDCKDEALSVSGDSSVYSEDGNIAKAARLEEPTRREWAAPRVTTSPKPTHAQLPTQGQGWTPADASAVYNVHGWSEGYFEVTSDGHLAVKPQGGEKLKGQRWAPALNMNPLQIYPFLIFLHCINALMYRIN